MQDQEEKTSREAKELAKIGLKPLRHQGETLCFECLSCGWFWKKGDKPIHDKECKTLI